MTNLISPVLHVSKARSLDKLYQRVSEGVARTMANKTISNGIELSLIKMIIQNEIIYPRR